jgi:hypothetical protein
VAVAVLLVAQAYLLLGPSKEAAPEPAPQAERPATAATSAPDAAAASAIARIPQQRRPSIIDLTGSSGAPVRHRL